MTSLKKNWIIYSVLSIYFKTSVGNVKTHTCVSRVLTKERERCIYWVIQSEWVNLPDRSVRKYKGKNKSSDVRSFWSDTNLLGSLHSTGKRKLRSKSSSSHHRTSHCPTWTWTFCAPCSHSQPSLCKSSNARYPSGIPPMKKEHVPIHPYHIKTTIKCNYPLLF